MCLAKTDIRVHAWFQLAQPSGHPLCYCIRIKNHAICCTMYIIVCILPFCMLQINHMTELANTSLILKSVWMFDKIRHPVVYNPENHANSDIISKFVENMLILSAAHLGFFLETLIQLGEVKVDLANFDIKSGQNSFMSDFLKITYSCRNVLRIFLNF
jgi:hypothetical protein